MHRGLQWLKHLVLTPQWSVQDDLWHAEFSQTPVALAFEHCSAEDLAEDIFDLYCECTLKDERVLSESLAFLTQFIERYQRLPASREHLRAVLNKQPLGAIEIPNTSNASYHPINRFGEKIVFSEKITFTYLMDNWVALNDAKGKRYRWTLDFEDDIQAPLSMVFGVVLGGSLLYFCLVAGEQYTLNGGTPVVDDEILQMIVGVVVGIIVFLSWLFHWRAHWLFRTLFDSRLVDGVHIWYIALEIPKMD